MFHSDDARFLHLLQKWQDGDFTRRDEQELQALVRDNAFRREAWEGFQEHPEVDHNARLNALRERLRPEQRRRRIWLPQAMAAAAVFVVLLAALWFFKGPAPAPADTLAKTETPTLQTETMSDATASAPAAEAPQALRKSVEPIAKADKMIRQEEGAGTVFPDAVSEKKQQDEIAATDDKQAPAVVSSAAEESESAKEESKDLGDLATAPPAPVSHPPAEYEQMSTRAKTASKPQTSAPGQPASQANAMQDVDYNLLGLQDYLRRNARLPEAARQNNISGFVKVSFDLDKKRRPQNFKMLQTLGYGCDEEALRLLRAYNWSQFTQDTLTVEVPFVR